LHWRKRIQDLAFSEFYPDVAFRLLKEIADQDDIGKTTLQRVKAFMSGVYTHAREQAIFVDRQSIDRVAAAENRCASSAENAFQFLGRNTHLH
jgi:hypothetical protein